MIKVRVLLIIAFCSFINACSSLPSEKNTTFNNLDSYQERQAKIAQLNQWKLTGKIAFLEGKKRESANIYWQYFPKTQAQQLTLTTYLGIQVFSLTSLEGLHTLTLDGKSYTDTSLSRLLDSFTGYPLPTTQLTQWLFGLAANKTDQIYFAKDKKLPSRLTTENYAFPWQVEYENYQAINSLYLAKKLTIKHQNLTIKLLISEWTL
ncbi:lipoprotein insertase outer membrane protein LolB [Thalassotalea sp. 1_MG-2023]|uniref:lipoprotein insertase outer membrane protein LolB n=1 Tax=Thalassotalea sp. 1_MG-2023 TaxID=3062680 RepID=UPI0026E478A5|nr:lipoprotein insertase outer membrane protein LolB [Thalassotalea sp. 1_MG-2023]MDO6427958.1 lipoprotein insertase outer membrane protein LolB [Thalassotalea sp. 1_MG-2023]